MADKMKIAVLMMFYIFGAVITASVFFISSDLYNFVKDYHAVHKAEIEKAVQRAEIEKSANFK